MLNGLAFLQNIGLPELLVLLLIVLLLFGAKRLPELARGVGRSLSEFKKGMKDIEHDSNDDKKP